MPTIDTVNSSIKCDTSVEYYTSLGQVAKPVLKAIKEHCVECCGDDHPSRCISYNCPLYPFRLGKNPWIKRELTDEQREQLRERFAKCRQTTTTR